MKATLSSYTKEYQKLIEEIFLRAGFCSSEDEDGNITIETLSVEDDRILEACMNFGLFD